MTIMVAEAAPGAAAEAETAVSASGASRAASAPSARPARRRTPGAGRAAPRPRRTPAVMAMPEEPEGTTRDHTDRRRDADRARGTRNHGKRSLSFKAPKGDYHKVVAAEFLFAIAVVTVAPIVTPGSGSASTGPSPYGRQDITRLAGVFTLFFILALVSHGRPGKLAVAFGFLVDLGVLFRASQRGALKGIGSAFGSKGTGTKSSGGGGGAPPGGAVA